MVASTGGGGKRIRLAHRARDVTVNTERCLIKLNLIFTYVTVYLTGTEGRRGALRANKSMARVHLSRLVRYCQARRLDTVSNLPKSHDEVKAVIGSELQYDTITHTGQAWDQYDRRLGRFEYGKKLVNPNVAMELIAKVKPAASKERIVQCDGGGTALGHPRVFINLDKPGNHACGYCGLRFYNENVQSDGSDQIEV
ncbi:putative NADH dehydrogenase [ubiquinone] iron-sulfur protein 6 [Trichinella pseudospiralis]